MKHVHSSWYKRNFVLTACLSACLVVMPASAYADEPAATQPSQPVSAEEVNPAHAWLDRIDAAGQKLESLHASLRYEVVQGALGDKQVRAGSLFYDAKKPARFAVHFDRLLAGRRLLREDRWYIFDGRWLVEKIGERKQFIKREMIDPKDDAAANDNPLATGQGPFALPVTLRKDEVLKKYDVKLVDAPPGSDSGKHEGSSDARPAARDAREDQSKPQLVHLQLTPHVARRGEFTQLDLWYDPATLLPVRAATIDETENQTTVILSDVKVDQPITAKVFDTTPPQAADGWTVEIKAWETATE